MAFKVYTFDLESDAVSLVLAYNNHYGYPRQGCVTNQWTFYFRDSKGKFLVRCHGVELPAKVVPADTNEKILEPKVSAAVKPATTPTTPKTK